LPTIRELNLIYCPELKMLPETIEHLTNLKKLHLEQMPEELIRRLRDDANQDQAKVRHIPTIKLLYLTGKNRVVEILRRSNVSYSKYKTKITFVLVVKVINWQ
jgi:hypothetical protein